MCTESVKLYTWSRQWLAEVREYANIRHKYGQTWLGEMARLEGFEPSTLGSEVCNETCWDVFSRSN